MLLEGSLQALHDRALLACGRLDGVSTLLPDPELFLYAYVRREALLSSQIEGTQSSLSDLLLFELEEAPGVPFDDVVEALRAKNVEIGESAVAMVPLNYVPVNDPAVAKSVLKFIDDLEDNDDVQDVYANFDIPDDILQSVDA